MFGVVKTRTDFLVLRVRYEFLVVFWPTIPPICIGASSSRSEADDVAVNVQQSIWGVDSALLQDGSYPKWCLLATSTHFQLSGHFRTFRATFAWQKMGSGGRTPLLLCPFPSWVVINCSRLSPSNFIRLSKARSVRASQVWSQSKRTLPQIVALSILLWDLALESDLILAGTVIFSVGSKDNSACSFTLRATFVWPEMGHR